jgi:hypothetical protein
MVVRTDCSRLIWFMDKGGYDSLEDVNVGSWSAAFTIDFAELSPGEAHSRLFERPGDIHGHGAEAVDRGHCGDSRSLRWSSYGGHVDVATRRVFPSRLSVRWPTKWFEAPEILRQFAAQPGSGGHTPSDFPLVQLTQTEIEDLERLQGTPLNQTKRILGPAVSVNLKARKISSPVDEEVSDCDRIKHK